VSLSVGVDIGGTKVAAGVVDDDGTVLARARRDTPSRDARAVEATITDVVRELRDRYDVVAVGIGAAGFVDAERSRVRFAPHLAWRDEPLRDALTGALDLPVVVENDANAAAWAEWRFGAGRGESHLVCVTLGTGIGGGVVVDGIVQRGRFGMAGEFGHMVVVPDGRRCECGNRGCLEQYASGNVLGREARELARAGSPVTVSLLERVAGDVDALVGPVVTAAAREGDACAIELFEDVGRWLGIGLANLAAALDPGTFVIGGGVSEAGELLLGPARESFRRTLTGRGYRPEARVVRAAFGPEAGLVGAADLARRG
jgi:glucokinase